MLIDDRVVRRSSLVVGPPVITAVSEILLLISGFRLRASGVTAPLHRSDLIGGSGLWLGSLGGWLVSGHRPLLHRNSRRAGDTCAFRSLERALTSWPALAEDEAGGDLSGSEDKDDNRSWR
jgi:hypothetical protein